MAGTNSPSDEQRLAAGHFSSWMTQILGAIRHENESDVPCDGCTACCTSSQFIHIAPDETDTLACIPAELLFPAPRLPRGNVVLGFDERGHCPMLVDDRCSIYEHRPRTCRAYDCRIFAAAGIGIDEDDKVLIDRRARRWKFDYHTQADSTQHKAVRAAASFLGRHADLVPEGSGPTSATRRAVLAIQIHDLFVRPLSARPESDPDPDPEPDPEMVRVELRRRIRLRHAT